MKKEMVLTIEKEGISDQNR